MALVGKSNSPHSVPSNEDVVVLTMNTFESVCNKCLEVCDPTSLNYIPERKNLKQFLQSSTEGQLILYQFKDIGTLSDTAMNFLTQLIISREIRILFKQKKVSLLNPLKKLEISSTILIDLANEIATVFRLRSGIFYTPGVYDGEVKTGPTGKFVWRINYMRQILYEFGVLVHPVKSEPLTVQPESDNITGALTLLKDIDTPWETVEKSWDTTYFVRRELSKQKKDGPAWQFTEFPCLIGERGSHLIDLDFKKKFPAASDINETWPIFKNTLERFVLTRRFTSEESRMLQDSLKDLEDDKKDATLLKVLPEALKAATQNPTGRRPYKKQKVDFQEQVANKKNDRETFIVHVEVDEDVENIIENKRVFYKDRSQSLFPFILVVGPLDSPTDFYIVIDNVRYSCKSISKALELAIKAFLGFNFVYPKATHQVWMLIQKLCFKIDLSTDKLLTGTNKAFTFFENEFKLPIN